MAYQSKFTGKVIDEQIEYTKQLPDKLDMINKRIDELPSDKLPGVGKEGEGANAEIFNDYENNVAEGDFSTAKGKNTRAGAKCFRFDDNIYTGNQKYNHEDKYYLKDVTDEIFSKLQEIVAYKPFYTVVLNSNYDLQGKLIGVGTDELGTYIQVTNYLEINANVGTTLYDGSYVHFPDYAELGTENMGTGANAGGYDTQALAIATHSEGAGTKSIGKYAHTEGRDTLAAYAAHAQNRETASLGENSHTEGCRGATTGFSGHLEGASSNRAFDHIFDELGALKSIEALIEEYKKFPFSLSKGEDTHVEGKNNLGLRSHQHIEGEGNIGLTNHVHIQGKYAEIDYNNEYLDIVGNGADDENRKNIRTLDKEGNGWYAKDVYIRGKTFKDTSLTLNKEVPFGGYNYKEDFSSMPIYFSSNKIPADVIGNQYNSSEQKIVYTTGGTFDSSLENLPVELLGDGTFRLQQTLDRSGRYKFFDFFGTKERFTQDDIGRKFVISIRYKYENGYVRFGLMSKATGSYYTKFYETKGVITLKNTEWTVSTLEVTVDEQMVKEQIGLVTIDFAQVGSIIVDYIESVEVKTFEDILNNKADKEYVDEAIKNNITSDADLSNCVKLDDYKNNQGIITTPKQIDIGLDKNELTGNLVGLKIYGKTETDDSSYIKTVKDSIVLYIGKRDENDPLSFMDMNQNIPYELCEGDYIEIDLVNKKATYTQTKTKWIADDSIECRIQDGYFTLHNGNFINDDAPFESGTNTLSNIEGNFVWSAEDNCFYVESSSIDLWETTPEDLKSYLINNNCVVYVNYNEPNIKDITSQGFIQYIISYLATNDIKEIFLHTYYNNNSFDDLKPDLVLSYGANINSVVENVKQESKEYTDKAIAEIDIPQANVSNKVDVVDENGNFSASNENNEEIENGISLGKNASLSNNSIHVGTNTNSSDDGIIIGHNSYGDGDIIIGNDSSGIGNSVVVGHRANAGSTIDGIDGISIGLESYAEGGGICIGELSYAEDGISIGHNSDGHKGIAIGHKATVYGENYESIDAIQLGIGHNDQEGTLKVYNHLLMRADGSLPYVDKRMSEINFNQLLSLKYSTDVDTFDDLNTLPDEYKFKGALVGVFEENYLYYYTGSEWIYCGEFYADQITIVLGCIIPEHFGQVLRLEYPTYPDHADETTVVEYYQHYNNIKSDGTIEHNYVKLVVEDDLQNYVSKEYIDNIVGDINSALDELHQYALSLQGGGAE